MNSDRIAFLLSVMPDEELITFFTLSKTQISCIDEPLTFLNQLRDNGLVTEDLYKKVIKMRNKARIQGGVYQILDVLEKQGGPYVKRFWKCVFQDHILKKYSALRSLQNSFMDGTFRCHENLLDAEKPTGNENRGTKRKRSTDESDEGEEGSSSTCGSRQKKAATQPTILESTGSHRSSRSSLYPEDPLNEIKDDACFLCNEEGTLVHCTKCPRAFHIRCHLPMLQDYTPRVNWMCTFCVFKANEQLQIEKHRDSFLNSPVSEKLTDCRYLLMCMYKVDKMQVFTGIPTTTEAEWGSVISHPMWLDKVKSKLEDNKYTTVGEFVHDINLIFKNCQTLNNDNDFGVMGAKLKEIFERELQNIYKIQ